MRARSRRSRPAAGPHPLRQRRRRRSRHALSGLRAVVRRVPARGGRGALLVPRQGRRARRQGCAQAPGPTASSGTTRRARRPTSPATRRGRQRSVDRHARVRVVAARRRQRASPTDRSRSRSDTTVLGAGYVKVWIRSEKRNVDLQATISEVRPDDKETFVQGGWLRASMRKLDKEEVEPLAPVLSLRKVGHEADARTTDSSRPRSRSTTRATRYREGSRIRVTISAVGGDQPIWAFARAKPKGTPGGRHRLRQVEALEADPAGHPGRRHPDGASALPRAARRAVPRLRAVRKRS